MFFCLHLFLWYSPLSNHWLIFECLCRCRSVPWSRLFRHWRVTKQIVMIVYRHLNVILKNLFILCDFNIFFFLPGHLESPDVHWSTSFEALLLFNLVFYCSYYRAIDKQVQLLWQLSHDCYPVHSKQKWLINLKLIRYSIRQWLWMR